MSVLGVNIKDENEFYASYDDECWMILAKEIIRCYANKYACQIPTTAESQEEYSKLDEKTYLPIRQSILRAITRGPLKNVANTTSLYRAFEEKRLSYKASLGITWKENNYDIKV